MMSRFLSCRNVPGAWDAPGARPRPSPTAVGFAIAALLGGLWILTAAGCGALPLSPSPTPVPPPPPSPTPSPVPTPTPTPLPPVPLTIHFPETVSALEGVTVAVELPGLPERDPGARVLAQVFPPGLREPVWESPLEPVGDGRYVSPRPIYFSLQAVPGDWRLFVEVRSTVPVRGPRGMRFRQEPLPLWDLAGQTPDEVRLPVPQAFTLVWQEGDRVSGGRVWRRGRERVELWWTPGPLGPLTLDTAQMVEEATFPIGQTVEILSVEAVTRGKRPGFLFRERWLEGGAEALLLQSSSRYLYLLRVAVSGGDLTPLLREIQAAWEVK